MPRAGRVLLIAASAAAVCGASRTHPEHGGAQGGAALLEEALEGPQWAWRAARPAARAAATVLAAAAGHGALGDAGATRTEEQSQSVFGRWPKAWQDKLEPDVGYRFSPSPAHGGQAAPTFFSTRIRETGSLVRIMELAPKTPTEWADATGEVEMFRHLQGPGVVELFDAVDSMTWNGAETVSMLMEYDHGDIEVRAYKEFKFVSLGTKVQLLADLFRVLDRAARAGVAHRDLSPRSLRVFGNCVTRQCCRLKLGRFVSACTVDGGPRPCSSFNGDLTPGQYTAPEAMRTASADPKQDVWGAGLVLYAMLFGHLPTHFPGFTLSYVAELNLASLYRETPRLARILETMLRRDPAQRCTAAEALRELHRFAEEHHIAIEEEQEPSAEALAPAAGS